MQTGCPNNTKVEADRQAKWIIINDCSQNLQESTKLYYFFYLEKTG